MTRKIFIPLAIVVACLLIAAAIVYREKTSTQQPSIHQIEQQVQAEVDVPAGDVPVVAQVSDPSKLSGYSFFSGAQAGDIVLVYSAASKAVLYRPSARKIVDVSSLAAAAAPTPTPAAAVPSIAILNGTGVPGLAAKTQVQLQADGTKFTTLENANAVHRYAQTVVIDVSGQFAGAASAIAAELHGTLGQLPAGEAAPADTDILIIVGKTP